MDVILEGDLKIIAGVIFGAIVGILYVIFYVKLRIALIFDETDEEKKKKEDPRK